MLPGTLALSSSDGGLERLGAAAGTLSNEGPHQTQLLRIKLYA
jgi:hypothetical protein